ncbi:MAG: WecB/TagA/CpsF family glycosyltransferase [Verrucomicrobiota bacterium]
MTEDKQLYQDPDPRINVLGVRVCVLTLDTTADKVFKALDEERRGYVTVTGVHGIVESLDDQDLLEIHNRSFLTTPDGMPLVWLGKAKGFSSQMERVYGPDLMWRLLSDSRMASWKQFLFGGALGVPELLAETISRRFPSIDVVGSNSPPFRALTDREELELVDGFRTLGVNILWVGLSTPKQERFMRGFLSRHAAKLPKPFICFGVGAAFDIHTGQTRQAPRWIQKAGLEFMFRALIEPRRLLPRYAKIVPRFLGELIIRGIRKEGLKS